MLAALAELVAELRAGAATRSQAEVVEAMTTNETLFFRDKGAVRACSADIVMPALIAGARAAKAHPDLVRGLPPPARSLIRSRWR